MRYFPDSGGGGGLADNSVTLAKLQQIAQYRFLARYSSGTGNLETAVFGNNYSFNNATISFMRSYKGLVRAVTTANMAATQSGGTQVGSRLTATTNIVLTMDGVNPAVGDYVLFKNQTLGARNGRYIVIDAGTAGVSPWIVERATNWDGNAATGDVVEGDYVFVLNGTLHQGTTWFVTTTGAITVGTTVLTFQVNGNGNTTSSGAAGRIAIFGAVDDLTSNASFLCDSTSTNAPFMAIGTTISTLSRIRMAYSLTDQASTINGQLTDSTHTQTADNAFGLRGFTSSITLANATFNNTSAIATPALESFRSNQTVSGSAGTVTAISNYNARNQISSTATVTNAIGYQWQAGTNSGTLTNNYGFYAAAQTVGTFSAAFYSLSAAATGRYNLYMSGTAVNYFAGNTVIGADANNAANTFAKLAVYGTSAANCRIGFGFSGTYGQTYISADFSSVSQNGNALYFHVNQIGGTGTQVLQFVGNGNATFLNSISISTSTGSISSGTSSNFIAGNNTSTTVPSFVYAQGDTNTGYGRAAADVANVIAGGVEVQRWNGSGNTGIGNTGTISARLHVISTTEQIRTGYDSTNYFSTTISSTGSCTFDLVGTTPKFTFSDPVIISNLTSGRIPFATTSGELTDDADLTFATDTLTATKIVGSTSIKAGSAAGFISSDGSTGATGTFTTADLKTVTVKDGIITSIV